MLGYRKGEAFEIDLVAIGNGHSLAPEPAKAFIAMRVDARSAGVELEIVTAWRDYDWQKRLHKKYLKALDYWTKIGSPADKRPPSAARPGWSTHQAGTTVDLDTRDRLGNLKPAYYWLVKNAARFGFYNTVKSELWHYEYTGVIA
jgi:LAS superfamily LD-carboxypeptidase LdcB